MRRLQPLEGFLRQWAPVLVRMELECELEECPLHLGAARTRTDTKHLMVRRRCEHRSNLGWNLGWNLGSREA